MTNVPASEQGSGGVPLLDIRGLSVRFALPDRNVYAVNDIDLQVGPGEAFALVGESGSGKSVSMLSVMRLLESTTAVVSGSIRFDGREMTTLPRRRLDEIRGRDIGMVFQDPMSSLNPVHTVGRQIEEAIRLHQRTNKTAARGRAVRLLDRVGIPDAARRIDDYPHEFSGGMRQRAMLAMALACQPKLLIADEPTTALDVTVQNQIVALVRELQAELGMAVIWITHDLGVVAELADRVAVMYGGRIVESGTAEAVYTRSRHPYTLGLFGSVPRLDRQVTARLHEISGSPPTLHDRRDGCVFGPRCPMVTDACRDRLLLLEGTDEPDHRSACVHWEALPETELQWVTGETRTEAPTRTTGEVLVSIREVDVHFPVVRGMLGRSRVVVRAVDGVTLDVRHGQTLGVVGESGCGKTTLGRALVGLVTPTGGTIEIGGRPFDPGSGPHRRRVQMIFQDPFSSMNPGMRVGEVVAEPMRIHRVGTGAEIEQRVGDLLRRVGLSADAARRFPHEFSGGQRQRVAVARALAADPEVIVCDEAVSSLDVSVQAQIVNLLRDVQDRTGLSFVFIAHDLAVVRHISTEVAVMYLGRVVERACRDDLYADPLHPYTQALLAAVPVPVPGSRREQRPPPLIGDLPSPTNPPPGCRFHTRCPHVVARCSTETPDLREISAGRWVACHLAGTAGR